MELRRNGLILKSADFAGLAYFFWDLEVLQGAGVHIHKTGYTSSKY